MLDEGNEEKVEAFVKIMSFVMMLYDFGLSDIGKNGESVHKINAMLWDEDVYKR